MAALIPKEVGERGREKRGARSPTSSNLGLDSLISAVAVDFAKYSFATLHTCSSISHMITCGSREGSCARGGGMGRRGEGVSWPVAAGAALGKREAY